MSFVADEFVLVGLSHQSAPVEVRQQVAVRREDLGQHLEKILKHGGAREAWILSTCNRTEVLVVSGETAETEAWLRGELFKDLPDLGEDPLYVHRGVQAVMHVFSVTAGLDSQVLGESEILHQVKGATDAARARGALGTGLEALMQQAMSVGKRVRSRTSLGEGTLSVARAAVDLARKAYGTFRRIRAAVVGAGETGLLVARHLRDEGVGGLTFLNRTYERARKAAGDLGGEAAPLEALREKVAEANLTVVSVESPEPVLRPEHVDTMRLRWQDRPSMIIDLSVPRGVHPGVAEHPELLVQTLDDLEQIVARHRRERREAITAAGAIVVEEVHKFLALRLYDAFKPAIRSLGERFDRIRREVVEEVAARDGSTEELSRRLTRRLLDAAFEEIKEGTRRTQSEEALSRSYWRYQRLLEDR